MQFELCTIIDRNHMGDYSENSTLHWRKKMAIAREQIRDFQEKSLILGIGATNGFLVGFISGLIIGAYFYTKDNILATSHISGPVISIVTTLIWMIVTAVWTRKVADWSIWLRLIGENAFFCFVTTLLGYWIATLIGALGVNLLSRIL